MSVKFIAKATSGGSLASNGGNNNASWTATQASSGSAALADGSSVNVQNSFATGPFYNIRQGRWQFDTSGFPSGNTTFALSWGNTVASNQGTWTLEAYAQAYTDNGGFPAGSSWVNPTTLSGALGTLTSSATSSIGDIALSSVPISTAFGLMLIEASARSATPVTSTIGVAVGSLTNPYIVGTYSGASGTTKTLTSSTTITVGGAGANDPPSGTTAITFECWGAGGGGGGGKGTGGTAGDYSAVTVSCANGDVFTITVPSGGSAGSATTAGSAPSSDTTVVRSSTTLCRAASGLGGNTGASGVVGGKSSNIGTVVFTGAAGGAGGGGGTQGGGSGGGGAGSGGNGGVGAAGSTATTTARTAAGTRGTPDGGAGGQGGAKTSTAGTGTTGGTGLAGSTPGGGGGGGGSSCPGGAGGGGQVNVSWVASAAFNFFFNRQSALAYMNL